jgi:hypothetical protein
MFGIEQRRRWKVGDWYRLNPAVQFGDHQRCQSAIKAGHTFDIVEARPRIAASSRRICS